MFVCRGCLKDKEAYEFSMSKSTGPCENCHYTDVCADIPHAFAAIDPKWKLNLYNDLTRLGLNEEAAKWGP